MYFIQYKGSILQMTTVFLDKIKQISQRNQYKPLI